MNLLVIGSGGREHALVWKLAQSPRVKNIFAAPGNAGIARLAECLSINPGDIPSLVDFAKKTKIDLTIVGPELPLVLGIVDEFKCAGLAIFGPNKRASEIEGSKAFAKTFMHKYKISTPAYGVFTDPIEAVSYIKDVPIVVKADGLAAGKGVCVCRTKGEARKAIDMMLKGRKLGEAGGRVVIEEFMEGEEASFICFSDGNTVLPLASSQDHKAVYDGDKGPNTGGMGAYSPAPVVTKEMGKKVVDEVMLPTIKGLAQEGRPFVGVLYAGLMIKDGNPYVLEFNCRMGDPETQPLMVRLRSDLVGVIEHALAGELGKIDLSWDDRAAVTVVMASKGYPGKYKSGRRIDGIEAAEAVPGVVVFHAGTAVKDGNLVTNGGRVLGVTGLGSSYREAVDRTYEAAEKITWDGVHYRKDIGYRALTRIF